MKALQQFFTSSGRAKEITKDSSSSNNNGNSGDDSDPPALIETSHTSAVSLSSNAASPEQQTKAKSSSSPSDATTGAPTTATTPTPTTPTAATNTPTTKMIAKQRAFGASERPEATTSSNHSVRFSTNTITNEQDNSCRSETSGSTNGGGSLSSSLRNSLTKSNNSSNSKVSVTSKSLKNNLMRSQTRDPYTIFSIVRELGSGSMGSVQMCQKRADAEGGSARADFVKRNSKQQLQETVCCAPLFQSIHSMLPKNKKQDLLTDSERHDSSTNSNNPKSLFHQHSSLIDYSRERKRSNQYYALKSLNMDCVGSVQLQRELQNEVAILKTLDHPHIARALETFTFDSKLFICLELCSGGDLYSRDPYTEYDAAQILYSLTSAVRYLHCHDIIHRDLKFENVMFTNHDAEVSDVKLIDFGLSQKFQPDSNMKDTVGTVYTMAPELLAGSYNEKADVFSLGVVAFMLLSSSMPFYGKNRNQVIKRICRGKVHFKAKGWNNKSDIAKHLVLTLLNKKVDERPSSQEALDMIREWRDSCEDANFENDGSSNMLQVQQVNSNNSGGANSAESPYFYDATSERSCNTTDTQHTQQTNDTELTDSSSIQYQKRNSSSVIQNMFQIMSSIDAFSRYTTLKKLALLIVAYKSTSSEIGFLRRMFQTYFDVYQNGEISLEEFVTAVTPFYQYTPEELETLFQGMDVDGTGHVHYTEFLAATIEAHGSIAEDRLADAFDRMDCDDSGYITLENLRDFLGDDVPLEYLQTIVDDADILRDKRINYEEFLQLWNEGCDQMLELSKSEVQQRQKVGVDARSSVVSSWRKSSSVVSTSSHEDGKGGDDQEEYNVALKDESTELSSKEHQQQQQQLTDCMKTPTITNTRAQIDAVECFKKQKAMSIRASWC